jgi:hypothetical protein
MRSRQDGGQHLHWSSSQKQDSGSSRTTADTFANDPETAPLLTAFAQFHSSDESRFFDSIMEKVKNTKFARFVDNLAVPSEPGLTNSQLMLNNHDLKPVEPERRQWGAWNFVGFWIADSFNIVGFFSTAAWITY